MANPVCVVVGVGPGNGTSIPKMFANNGYQVALLSRDAAKLSTAQSEVSGARTYTFDATDPSAAGNVFPKIKEEMGPIDVLVYNAGSGVFGSIDDLELQAFEDAWRVNTFGLAAATQAVLPQMREAGSGNIVVIGATSAVKHNAKFSAFTSAKAAQRALAQSLAKHLWPENIHVAYVIVDGVIDIPRTREMMKDAPDDFFLKPDEIAESVYYLTQQPKSAWSFELDVRPFGEKW